GALYRVSRDPPPYVVFRICIVGGERHRRSPYCEALLDLGDPGPGKVLKTKWHDSQVGILVKSEDLGKPYVTVKTNRVRDSFFARDFLAERSSRPVTRHIEEETTRSHTA